MVLDRVGVVLCGITTTLALFVGLIIAQKKHYFRNKFDLFFHATVVIDLLLEAVIIIDHNHYGFYLCALAFTLVIGGYRVYVTVQE